jgi:cell wall assembly regulator SMI1
VRPWIDRLDRWLRHNRPRYYEQLQPGLHPDAIREAEATFGFPLPDSLRDLYHWKDGQAPGCLDSLYYNFMFQSLRDTVGTWQVLDDLARGEFQERKGWFESWVPFLDNNGGDHLCVDVRGSFGGDPGQLVWFLHETGEREVEYPDLDTWGEVYVSSLEQGIWIVDALEGLTEVYYGCALGEMDAYEEFRSARIPGYPWTGWNG